MARAKASVRKPRTQKGKDWVDPLVEGFQCQLSGTTKATDYLTNPQTGLRPGENKEPYGHITTDLHYGDITYKTLPPMKIWQEGHWYADLPEEDKQEIRIHSEDSKWRAWVTSGEGTPGNYAYRVFYVPDDIAGLLDATHPIRWGTIKPKPSGTGWKSQASAPSIPLGVRYRCIGCGHWFSQNDLAPHINNCCPGVQGDNFDWAIKCECGTACSSLDDTAKIKPGFPRAMASPVTKEETHDSAREESSSESSSEGEGTDRKAERVV